jgi:NitT/TauT family transport system substrate-binding protein
MKDTGLDIYGTSLIVKDEDIKKRPEFVRAYVEGTLEGLRYARDNQEDALKTLNQFIGLYFEKIESQ